MAGIALLLLAISICFGCFGVVPPAKKSEIFFFLFGSSAVADILFVGVLTSARETETLV